jgi:hypothetical protein
VVVGVCGPDRDRGGADSEGWDFHTAERHRWFLP